MEHNDTMILCIFKQNNVIFQLFTFQNDFAIDNLQIRNVLQDNTSLKSRCWNTNQVDIIMILISFVTLKFDWLSNGLNFLVT